MRSSRRLATFLFFLTATLGLRIAAAATLEDEVLAFEAQDRASPPPTGSVVVTGSSSIRLWTTITTDLAPLGVIPRGFGGSTSDDLDYYLERLVLVYQPRAVAIYEGDNDIAAGRTPQQVADKMTTILARISARLPNARVYVISIKPSPLRWANWSLAVDANARLAALCATDARYVYVNVAPVLLGSNGQPRPEYYQADQLHLNAAGYAAWTSVVRPVLHAQQLQPLPPDAAAPAPPSGLLATALSRTSVDLQWNAASDAGSGLAGYRVSRNGVAVATTTATHLTDTGLASNTAYTYTVAAYDRASPANTSAASAPASATTLTDPAPTVSLAASPASIASGSTSTLNWSSTNATACSASGGWSGARAISGSSATAALTATTAFTLSCSGSGGSASATASVTVNSPPTVALAATPAATAAGGNSTLTWSSSNATSCTASGGWSGPRATGGSSATSTLAATTTYSLACTGAGGSTSASATVTVIPAPTVTLTSTPGTIASGGSATLAWTSTNASACTSSGAWSGSRGISGSASTGALVATSTYDLSCSGTGGAASASTTVTVTPPATPAAPTVTLSASPATVAPGGVSVLTWSSSNSSACTATGGWSGAKATAGTQPTPALGSGTSFTLSCTGAGGSATTTAAVAVASSPTAPTLVLSASSASVARGSATQLQWSTTGATSCTAAGGWTGPRGPSGSETSALLTTGTTFSLSCTGAGGTISREVSIAVIAPAPTLSLAANPSSVTAGSTSRLAWSSTDATTCTASGDWAGDRATTGDEITVALSRSATYTLACVGSGGRVEATATVAVTPAPVSSAPSGSTPASSSGGGGGGSLQWQALLALAALAARRRDLASLGIPGRRDGIDRVTHRV